MSVASRQPEAQPAPMLARSPMPARMVGPYDAHVREQARRILVGTGVAIALAILTGLALDTLFLSHTPQYATLKVAMPLQALTAAAGAGLLAFWGPARRHPHVVCGLMGGLLTGLSAYSLSTLGGMDGPFFYVSYIFPCVALGVPASLRDRVLIMVCLQAPFLGIFFGLHPEYVQYRYAHVGFVYLIVVTLILAYFGHRLQEAARELFVLRFEALERSEGLAREVKLQEGNVVAVIDRAEAVRSEERRQLARTLHDDMGQLIVSARAGLQNLERSMASRGSAPDLSSLRYIVEDIERSARSVVGALREEQVPFEVAVEDLVEMFRALERVEVHIDLQLRGWEPSAEVREVCLRVVQEGLTNVLKHASATRAEVAVRREDAHVVVAIRDDGRGIEPGRSDRGFGLAGMRERVEEHGGSLQVARRPVGGTELRATLPHASSPFGELGGAS